MSLLPTIPRPGTADQHVPLRYVAERLGLQVTCDEAEKLYDLVPAALDR